MYRRETRHAARWVVWLRALLFLLIMHLMLPNTGGSGADLPQAQLVWCAMLVLIAGCAWILVHRRLRFSPCARTLTMAALLLTLPWLWSPSPDWRLDALPRLAGLWAGLLLYVLLLNCHFTARQKQRILWLMAAAALIQTLWVLAGMWCPSLLPQVAQDALRAGLSPGLSAGVFQQRNVTASFIATGAAVLLWLAGDSAYRLRGSGRQRMVFVAIGVMFMTLTLLSSRTGWLGGLLSWLLFIVIFWRNDRLSRWGVRLAPAAGIALGVALLPDGLLNALHDHDSTNLDRLLILQQTWQMIAQHPLVGWGYGGFTWSFAHFLADRAEPLSRGVVALSHPHNELLFWWVEGGIVALAGELLAIVAVGMLLLRRLRRKAFAVLGCMLPVLLHTQLEYPLYLSPVHWLLLLLLLRFADSPGVAAASQGTPGTKKLMPCLIGILACFGAVLTAMTFWQGQELTGFQQSPQRYASRVLRLHETGIGTERLRKDKALSYILRYQKSGNVDDLQQFSDRAHRWLATWCDADIYHNLINVDRYLGNEASASQLHDEAHRLYPYDPLFFS